MSMLQRLKDHLDQEKVSYDDIVSQAGTHHEAVKLRYQDFADLVRPAVVGLHASPSEIKR